MTTGLVSPGNSLCVARTLGRARWPFRCRTSLLPVAEADAALRRSNNVALAGASTAAQEDPVGVTATSDLPVGEISHVQHDSLNMSARK